MSEAHEDCPYCDSGDVEEEGGCYFCRRCSRRWRFD